MIKTYCVSISIKFNWETSFNINFNFSAVEEYRFLQKLKYKLSNDSEEIGENDIVHKFFSEFEAYHNDRINLKVALSPCKVSY